MLRFVYTSDWQTNSDEMIFNIIIGTSLFVFSLAESSSFAVSTITIHRDDVPFSYDYSTMYFYDKDFKKDLNGYRNKSSYEREGNFQYPPLVFDIKEEDTLSTFNKKTTISAYTELTDLAKTEVSTNKNNVQPQFHKQYTEYRNTNGNASPLQNLSGHDIRVEPITKEMVFKSEISQGFRNNNGYQVKDTAIRSNIHQSDSNTIKSKSRQEMRYFPGNAEADSFESLKIFKRSRQKKKPLKYIQVLPVLETANIQAILNPYNNKGPQLHLNTARALKIAHGQNKAPNNRNRKRISINRLKHKYVPNIDQLLEHKSFLFP